MVSADGNRAVTWSEFDRVTTALAGELLRQSSHCDTGVSCTCQSCVQRSQLLLLNTLAWARPNMVAGSELNCLDHTGELVMSDVTAR